MRSAVMVAIASMAVMARASSTRAQEVPASPQSVGVLVSNRANLRPEMLQAAEDDAATIYRVAGVQLTWVNAGPTDVGYDYAVDFIVMIVSGKEAVWMARRADLDAGFAVRDSNDEAGPGGTAFVLFDRVDNGASSHHVSISRVLVIAHELGHLLLPGNSHSERGIMRPAWNLRSGLLEYFTPAQAETIQRRLASRRGKHAAAQQDVNAAHALALTSTNAASQPIVVHGGGQQRTAVAAKSPRARRRSRRSWRSPTALRHSHVTV